MSFVATIVCLLRQKVCRDNHSFVLCLLGKCDCWDKTFVATKMIVVTAPSNDTPAPSSPTETLSGLLQIKPQDISFSKTIDLPCFLFRAGVLKPPPQVSVCCLFKLCVTACVCVCVCLCVRACVRACMSV